MNFTKWIFIVCSWNCDCCRIKTANNVQSILSIWTNLCPISKASSCKHLKSKCVNCWYIVITWWYKHIYVTWCPIWRDKWRCHHVSCFWNCCAIWKLIIGRNFAFLISIINKNSKCENGNIAVSNAKSLSLIGSCRVIWRVCNYLRCCTASDINNKPIGIRCVIIL